MALFSVVVVTWNNENFIEQALRSCIFPGANDYEVIVVHNASTDRTGACIQRVVSEHPHIFKVVENDRNEGLGEARNIGVRHASGKYVLFLDGDDWFEPETYEVLSRLVDGGDIDVVVFNHARVWDNGGKIANAKTALLRVGDCNDVEARNAILENFNVAWNKLYRREFLQAHGLSFSRRLYEDIDWHFKVLALAESYFATPEILINYRQRTGSILRSRNNNHFDIIEQYQEVLNFLQSNPDNFKAYGKSAYRHAANLMMGIIREARLPPSSERAYLRKANRLLSDWRALLGETKKGTYLTLASIGSGVLLRKATGAKNLMKSVKAFADKNFPKALQPKVLRARSLRLAYRAFCKLPFKKNMVLLESYWGAKADCNPMAIAKGLQAMGGYDLVWSLNASAKTDIEFSGMRRVNRGGFRFAYTLARAKYLVTNGNFPTEYEKRPGSVHVQTKHGTPLKTMGLDIRKKRPKEMNWTDFAERCRRWDFVISSNPYSSRIWRQGFPYTYEVLEIGYPRNDMLFNSSAADVDRIRKKIGVPEGKKIALYAPTFRDRDRNTSGLNKAEIFDPVRVAKALGPDYALVIREHYFNTPGGTARTIINASDYPKSNDVVLIADLLITDYSSIMFDYACLNRPIVIYAYDIDNYIEERGMYLDLAKIAPGSMVYNQNELLQCLENGTYDSAESQRKLTEFRNEFCPWDDGYATDRAIKAIFHSPL
jgi:CDP-glycerol glycerophosphotransferase